MASSSGSGTSGGGGDVDVAKHQHHHLHYRHETGSSETASLKSWALQAQESYQLQLALALRLSSQASSAEDPNFLDLTKTHLNGRLFSSSESPQSLSHRFWVNGCLSYSDKITNGFYLIQGMDPYAWNISTDQGSTGRIPSLESLMDIDHGTESSIKVFLVDEARDPGLKELQNWVSHLSGSWVSTVDVIQQLANVVCNRMGDAASGEEQLVPRWNECVDVLSDCLGSIVIPIGYLSAGLCVHRALLFKILADMANLPCRIVKGCKYCNKDVGSSCLVQFGSDREYLVDLLGMPGVLSQPDSSFNNVSSIVVSSPLCHPRFKSGKTVQDFRALAQLYFFDCQPLSLVFDEAFSEGKDKDSPRAVDAFGANHNNKDKHAPTSLASHFLQRAEWNPGGSRGHRRMVFSDPSSNAMNSTQPRLNQLIYHRAATPPFSNIVPDSDQNQRVKQNPCHEFYLEANDSDIQWNELVLKKTIGSGSFGTVYYSEWRGSEVAVKILKEQEFVANNFEEFLKEVSIMKRLRHPNIVSFLGAITQPPKLSIVTEYLSNGCLYKLLRRPDARAILDERLRLNMACDVAKGMNYLHQLQPPIVHRDLKSPNLLVDCKFTVKVCDFGLSRSKANTFLSSKTAAGTPEWMAPEVLRAEPSNEKSDVYSFGVILWELMTLQPPWRNLSSAQVVGAVAFKNMRLDIPTDLNPQVAALIEICWASEPIHRPSFLYIIEALHQLILNCPR